VEKIGHSGHWQQAACSGRRFSLIVGMTIKWQNLNYGVCEY
jgi:hypothetical protein